MVRYSGFLSNRKRGTLLPRVCEALQMHAREKPEKPGFAVLMKGFLAQIRTNVSCLATDCVCRRSGRYACNGATVGKAAWNGEKAMVANIWIGSVRLKSGIPVKNTSKAAFSYIY